MRFWDSSAFVSLFVDQQRSCEVRRLMDEDVRMTAWILTDVEVYSAFERLRRSAHLTEEECERACLDFEGVWNETRVVLTVGAVKLRARRILALHELGASDALQLGAAQVAADENPRRVEFVCLDRRLAVAARREGFVVIP